jgi:hypothetical protein
MNQLFTEGRSRSFVEANHALGPGRLDQVLSTHRAPQMFSRSQLPRGNPQLLETSHPDNPNVSTRVYSWAGQAPGDRFELRTVSNAEVPDYVFASGTNITGGGANVTSTPPQVYRRL